MYIVRYVHVYTAQSAQYTCIILYTLRFVIVTAKVCFHYIFCHLISVMSVMIYELQL